MCQYKTDLTPILALVLQISCDRDDRRFLGDLKFLIPGLFWGRKIWQVFFGWLDLCTKEFFGYLEQSEDS